MATRADPKQLININIKIMALKSIFPPPSYNKNLVKKL